MKFTKRKIEKACKILRNTRINGDFIKFIGNFSKRKFARLTAECDIPYPTTISLELTNKCNLKCTMCPREHKFGRELEYGNMDTNLAKKIIDEIYPYVVSVGLTGLGETLFANNLEEVAKYIKNKKKSIVIFISTNANIPDFIEKASKVLPYIDTIQISIDGTSDTYESIRVGGRFESFEHNIRQLVPLAKKHHVDVMFNMVVSKENYEEMPLVIEFAAKHKVPFVNFNYINVACIPEFSAEYYEFFSGEEFKRVLNETIRKKDQYSDLEVTGLVDFKENLPGKCHLIWDHFQINYDGEIPPCCAKPFSKQLSFGNVKDESVISVLNSERAKLFRKTWENGKSHPFCRNCHLSTPT